MDGIPWKKHIKMSPKTSGLNNKLQKTVKVKTCNTQPAAVPLIEMHSISKDFPGVRALDNVNFDIQAGEIHALVGENGAGKSTLMKILCGIYPYEEFSGEIKINGRGARFFSITDSEKAGISIIHQELALVKYLTAAENIFLGDEPGHMGFIDWDLMFSSAQKLVDEFGIDLDVRTEINKIGIGKQQLVEIVKALRKKSRILVLDEPTAALSEQEIRLLFSIMDELRKKGTSMVYISHKLDEVMAISDRVTVLRDGKTISSDKVSNLTRQKIIKDMVGRELTEMYPRISFKPGNPMLTVENFSVEDIEIKGRKILDNISFEVNEGEVLGISGLMGAGRSELFFSIFGSSPGSIVNGNIYINGSRLDIHSPLDAVKAGLALVTEDRKNSGLVMILPVLQNISMVHLDRFCYTGFINEELEYNLCSDMVNQLNIRAPSLYTEVENLSGGNQQKVALGKWLLKPPKVLLLDEPTRGIDVGAKVEIYKLINELKKQGVAILMASSELPEILGIADRIIVLREGKITGEFHCPGATQEQIMEAAT
jgi:D-xylose transport system ATP-binding protein